MTTGGRLSSHMPSAFPREGLLKEGSPQLPQAHVGGPNHPLAVVGALVVFLGLRWYLLLQSLCCLL